MTTDNSKSNVFFNTVLVLVIAALAGWVTYAVWTTAEGNRKTSEAVRLACIEAGATWVGNGANTCIILPRTQSYGSTTR